MTRLAVARIDVGERTVRTDAALTRKAPTVAVLTTAGDEVVDWLRTGQALQRALLIAAAQGVHAGHANQQCQVPALPARLRAALRLPGQPQLVLRLGIPAEAPPPTPRRPVTAVLDTRVQPVIANLDDTGRR